MRLRESFSRSPFGAIVATASMGIAAACSGASTSNQTPADGGPAPTMGTDGSTDAIRDGAAPSRCPPGWLCPEQPLYTSQIGIWYWTDFEESGDAPACPGSWAGSRYKPLRGYYDSASPAVIDDHFGQLRKAGVDYILLDFTNGIAPDPKSSHIYAAGEVIMQRNADTSAPTHMPFALAIGAQLWSARSRAGHENEANFVISHYAEPGGKINPTYFRWKGKPLVITYNDWVAPNVFYPDWDDARFSIGRANPVLSTANVPLDAIGSSWWGWVSQYPVFRAKDVITVSPGADNTHRCDCVGTIHSDRNGGTNTDCSDCDIACTYTPAGCPAFATKCSSAMTGGVPPTVGTSPGIVFELEWLRAMKENPETIVIASWNEFGDETAIEPAVARTDGVGVSGKGPAWTDYYGDETPDWYLQIASAYAHLRTGLEPEVYYRDEDSTRVFLVTEGKLVLQAALPHKHPVIILPAGTLARLGAATRPKAPIPPSGTIMTTPGLPPAMIVDKVAIRFEVEETARKFGEFTPVSKDVYEAVPHAGMIRRNAPAFVAPALPPAFESDVGELWQFDCLEVLGTNGSHLNTVQQLSHYSAFPVRGGLHCKK